MGRIQRPPFVRYDVPTHGSSPHWTDYVIHTTEGANQTIENLAAYFRRTEQGLGVSHIIQENGRMGTNGNINAKTHHVKNGNHHCRGVELVGFAGRSTFQWYKNIRQLWAVAWLMAYVSQGWDIPIQKSLINGRRVAAKGFCGHGDVPGNDHWDPGPNFPWGFVFRLARRWRKNGVPLHVRLAIPKR